MPASKGGAAVLGYRDHYVVDGGKARIILRALVTPASIMDNTPMLDLTNWVCERWKIKPRIAVGDSKCTKSKSGRHIFRSFYQEYVEKVKTYNPTPEYQKAMSKRAFWVEPLFGEAKDFHRLRRFRLRGLLKVNIEGVMIAAGQNIKRLLQHALGVFCFVFNQPILSFNFR
jgi:hypothetical protein